ncbi:DNA-binding ATPase [Sporobolomyces koalae]|uniref:DNA-binding ATPase n=1 Tax=Sporobolomyces koalae TaxID=500713 RepID=UPI00317CDA7C
MHLVLSTEWIYLALTILYLIDVVVRIAGFGWVIFTQNHWHIYDLVVVSGTLATTIPLLLGTQNQIALQLQKLFLVAIVFKLVQRSDSLNQLQKTAVASLPAILNIFALWVVLFLVFAIFYIEVFGLTRWQKLETHNANYYTFANALVLLVLQSTGEGWNEFMHDYASTTFPRCTESPNYLESDCSSSAWAYALFIIWNVLSMYLFVNLVLGAVIENFSFVFQEYGKVTNISREQMRSFKKVWTEFDPDRTGYLQKEQIPRFLSRLSGVLDVKIYRDEWSVHSLLGIARQDPVTQHNSPSFHHYLQDRDTLSLRKYDLERLRAAVSAIDSSEVDKRKSDYNLLYHEAMLDAESSDKGVSFNGMLRLLAHYRLIDDDNALQIDELIERRKKLQEVYTRVRQDRLDSFFAMILARRHFLLARQARRQDQMGGLPAIQVEPEETDGPKGRTDIPVSISSAAEEDTTALPTTASEVSVFVAPKKHSFPWTSDSCTSSLVLLSDRATRERAGRNNKEQDMGSRLDRLVLLLDTGTTPSVRLTAARQLGQLAGTRIAHPSSAQVLSDQIKSESEIGTLDQSDRIWRGVDGEWNDVLPLVARILPHLQSRSSETRQAAASALGHISRAVGIWDPASTSPSSTNDGDAALSSSSVTPRLLSLQDFDLERVLSEGSLLLSSSGKEYASNLSNLSAQELAQAQKEALGKLGLNFDGNGTDDIGVDVEAELAAGAAKNGVTESSDTAKTVDTAAPSDLNARPALPPPRFKQQTAPTPLPVAPSPSKASPAASASAPEEADDPYAGLSARERNKLKRKRKAEGKAGTAVPTPTPAPAAKRTKIEPMPPVKAETDAQDLDVKVKSEPGDSGKVVIDPGAKAKERARLAASAGGGEIQANSTESTATSLAALPGEWPWHTTVSRLSLGLLSPAWEVRHGSALGLREILRLQGQCGGMVEGVTALENSIKHEEWAGDVVARLSCVLALDRFGDYVSDQVIAPVRETCAQVLAVLLPHMSPLSASYTLRILVDMVEQRSSSHKGIKYAWQVRHSGLLSLKYFVAVKGDLLRTEQESAASSIKIEAEDTKPFGRGRRPLLESVVSAARIGLRDRDDDVRSAAAATLLPLADALVHQLPNEMQEVVEILWECLGDLKDDLASSVGGVMDLLAELLGFPEVIALLQSSAMHTPLPQLIPRLFPFFRHTITSVRHSVLKTSLVFLDLSTLDPATWVDFRLYRLLFQNLLLEQKPEIRRASQECFSKCLSLATVSDGSLDALVKNVSGSLPAWFAIIRSPIGVPLNPTLFWSARDSLAGAGVGVIHNVDKPMLNQDLALVSTEAVLRGKVEAAKAVGHLMRTWPSHLLDATFADNLEQDLAAASALTRFTAATIIEEWAAAYSSVASTSLSSRLITPLHQLIASDLPSNVVELQPILNRLRLDCVALYAAFSGPGKVSEAKLPTIPDLVNFTQATAQQVQTSYAALLPHLGLKPAAKKNLLPQLEERYRKVESGLAYLEANKTKQERMVFAALGGALIALKAIPAKMTPLIRSVTSSIKSEENADLQARSAYAIAAFIDYCSSPASTLRANPSEKLIKNLCTFLCQDVTRTPIFASAKQSRAGILTLEYEPARGTAPTAKELKEKQLLDDTEENRSAKLVFRGAELALQNLSSRFGMSLIERVPKLWSCMTDAALQVFASGDIAQADALLDADDTLGQDLLDSLTVLPAAGLHLSPGLRPRLAEILPALAIGTRSKFAVVRFAVAKCLAMLCDIVPEQAMKHIIEGVVPSVSDPINVNHRRGAVELISHIVDLLDIKILPYVIFLVVPVLGRMSDSDDDVRLVATNTFASLVKLVPLEAGLPDPPGFSPELLAKRETEREFLMQLLDGSKVAEYKIPVDIGIELRKYQRDGVSWLAFLARYQLHGLLCDDMGLGKTLQSICILASMHHERAERHRANNSPDSVHLPSLIICPPTLTGHWKQEINTYAKALRCVIYTGPRADRERLVKNFRNYDAVITSYDIARNDVEILSPVDWHYLILDEGHIIKNGKTKLTKAVKSLKAIHRLILSGTPIQNNVLELWSLFDFLMPGFLGSEKAFNERFGKPIAASRDAKSSSKEQEAGAAALEALHKQVLPFLLRRLKEDVLDDLPPKIIQDYYVELSPLQKQLYDDFSGSQAGNAAKGEVSSNAGDAKPQHVFQALQYLRKLVNHPALVFKPDVPQHQAALTKSSTTDADIRNVQHAPKLMALRQILLDSGIGTDSTAEDDSAEEGVSRHRVLIFCQLKQMLDIVESDLFRKMMPSVTYMRLDGSTDVSKRHAVVQTFNADPSIDVLLLTTHVGGLGLNLTSADTVIFVEHDWNPMKDLQAMDRAHRLGQKRVVNVYRLIMRGTLEEKIMGLQRFKLNIASSVVTQQNSNLDSLGTDQILDLFQVSDTSAPSNSTAQRSADKPMSQKAILDSLSDLPADDEYNDLDVSAFTSSLA